MIEITYAYVRNDNKVTQNIATFHNTEKAVRFMYKLKSHPKMVFMNLECDDPYDDAYIRRRCGL